MSDVRMETFAPMLSGKAPGDLAALRYPVLVSPKLDGIRVIIRGGVVLSRNLKPIPNRRVQRVFGQRKFNGLDGELIVGDPCASDAFNATTSGVMTAAGEPDVTFHVFDYVDVRMAFRDRQDHIANMCEWGDYPEFAMVDQHMCDSEMEVDFCESMFLQEGYEGAMIRDPRGYYKFGRSTTKEEGLLKLKRFEDSEAVVLALVELESNQNEKTKDALGRTKRTSHKAGKVKMGTLGAFSVRDLKTGVCFEIGSGFKAMQRDVYWQAGDNMLGQVVKYRYFPTGTKEKPRFPTYLGIRDARDM